MAVNKFFPNGYYVEEKVVMRWAAMNSFKDQGFSEEGVGTVVNALYDNNDYLKYINAKEESCKNQVLTKTGPGEESIAILIEDLDLVLHGIIEIIEVSGDKGDAFEVTFAGLDEPQRVRLNIVPQPVQLF